MRAGSTTPIKKIEAFLLQKEKWIEKHLTHFSERKEKFPPKKLSHAEEFPFLGEILKLRYVPTPLKQIFFSRNSNYLQMHIPISLWQNMEEPEIKEHLPRLQRFYQQEAESYISERIKIWSDQMGLKPKEVKFRNQKSRWGSCSSRGTISINWRLIAAPIDVIDYILIHELAHLRHMNHSKDFWQLVQQYCENLSTCEKWLKDQSASLDFLS